MELSSIDRAAHAARRDHLARLLGDRPALLASGTASPRVYAANTFPFRAASHFLYLTGLAFPSFFLFWDGQRFTLFTESPSTDAALWHGESPSFPSLTTSLGVPVRDAAELRARLAERPVATLPAIDLATCLAQSDLLGRAIRPGALAPIDEPLADAMIALRLAHDDAAVASMRHAVATTARAHAAGMSATAPGVRESELRAVMEAEMLRDRAAPAYGSIITREGEVLHHDRYDGVLADGDMVLADVGSESHDGWASDVTRTWPVSGTFSPTQRALYEIVLAANRTVIDSLRPGVRWRDSHLLAARVLAEGLAHEGVLRGSAAELVETGAVALFFPHGVGHLIGLDVHDMEDLGDRAGYAPGRARSSQFGLSYLRLDRDLTAGMCVTVEPGIYQVPAIQRDPRFAELRAKYVNDAALSRFSDVRGIRIEDDVLITERGAEVLTRAIPKDPVAVEEAVRG